MNKLLSVRHDTVRNNIVRDSVIIVCSYDLGLTLTYFMANKHSDIYLSEAMNQSFFR